MERLLRINTTGTTFHWDTSTELSADTTLTATDDAVLGQFIACNANGGSFTVKLPQFSGRLQPGSWIAFYDTTGDALANPVSIDPDYLVTNYTINDNPNSQYLIDANDGLSIIILQTDSATTLKWRMFKVPGAGPEGIGIDVSSTSTNTTVGSTEDVLIGLTDSAAVTITLPPISDSEGRRLAFKRSGTNNLTIAVAGFEFIDGGASVVMANDNDSVSMVSDGINWYVVANYDGSTW